MGGRILREGVVRVVGDDGAQSELAREELQHRPDPPLVGDAVVLQLDEEVVGPEHVAPVRQCLTRGDHVVAQQVLVHLRAQASRQDDESGTVGREELEVDARLVPIPLHVGGGRERDEVAVAGIVLGQHRQVVVALLAVGPARALLVARPDRLVELRAQDRPEPGGGGGLLELDETEEDTVVGDGHRRLLVTGDGLDQVGDARRPVEHRVIGVHVQVDEPAIAARRHPAHSSRGRVMEPGAPRARASRPRPSRVAWTTRPGPCAAPTLGLGVLEVNDTTVIHGP